MKRLLVYLFIVFGLGFMFSTNANSKVYCVDEKIGERIESFRKDYLKRENEFFYISKEKGTSCMTSYKEVNKKQYNTLKNYFRKAKLKIEPKQNNINDASLKSGIEINKKDKIPYTNFKSQARFSNFYPFKINDLRGDGIVYYKLIPDPGNKGKYYRLNKDFNVDVGLVGDTKLTLEMMVEEVKVQLGGQNRKGSSELADQIAEINDKWMAEWSDALTSDETPITPYRVIGEMINVLDQENSIVTHDAGAPRDIIMPFYPGTVPHSYVGWGKTTHLGFSIPLMIGAKKANPDKFCLNLMGDGAFGMSGLDLETSVRAELPITTVILNNGAMSTYEGTSLIGPVSKKEYGVSSMKGDYAEIAKGMGAEGIRVEKTNELAMAFKNAQQLNKDGKTVLIDVIANIEGRRSSF